jgi:transposase InsO family protein
MRFAFIATHAQEFRITTMCRVLQVSKAGYYAWVQRPQSARGVEDAALLARIETVFAASHQTYGSPRVHAELLATGDAPSVHGVARVMRTAGLRATHPRRFQVTTDSNHPYPIAPNVLARQFAVEAVPGLNRVWIGDITYITTLEGWLYLAVVIDLRSRRVIGWAMRHTLEGAITRDALTMALEDRRPAAGCLLHSNRGSQCAAHDYQAVLVANGMIPSMSRTGDCWDNAVAESFFATLKRELVDRVRWRTRDEARAAIFTYIESWYNRHRRHSSLGYVSPINYELQQTSLPQSSKAA